MTKCRDTEEEVVSNSSGKKVRFRLDTEPSDIQNQQGNPVQGITSMAPRPDFAHIPEPAKEILMRGSDIERSAETAIKTYRLYQDDGETPFPHGPKDQHLGTAEGSYNCQTCGEGIFECPGHFGFVKMALPVFHVGYFKHTLAILQSVCKGCARILLTEPERQKALQRVKANREASQNLKVLKSMIDECKKMRQCVHCGTFNGIVKKKPSENLKIVHDKFAVTSREQDLDDLIRMFEHQAGVNSEIEKSLKEAVEDIDPLKTQQIFQKIRDEDICLFHMEQGLCKPLDLLITHMPAPPVCIRPSVAVSATVKNEDDLTFQLAEMAHLNAEIANAIARGMPTSKLLENWHKLQWACALYLNSETPGIPLDILKNKPTRGMSQRVKGKHGRFRQNLSGKRVDFTGRTVISPDPNCAIDEVIVPTLMAKVLTYPERVTSHNIEKMRKLILTGPEVHPGANFVESKIDLKDGYLSAAVGKAQKQTTVKISLMHARNRAKIADELKIGDTVERHLSNGDTVLFNRQPSLHRVSIMAHKARIMPNKTLRFNECVCTPYNADFDGDEMNIHVPQTEEARAEARTLLNVQNNICVPKAGEPLIAATQDFLTASFLLTQKDTFFNRSEFMQLCGYFQDSKERIDIPPPAILKPIELWTGKQVISVMLRPNSQSNVIVNATLKERNYTSNEQMCINDGYVVFQNSEHICGNLAKKTMGNGSKVGLFYSLIRDNSTHVAAESMLRISKFSARWLSTRGMSIGIGDVTPFAELVHSKMALIDKSYKRCDEMISEFNSGQLTLKAGCNAEQSLENGLNGELGQIREKAGEILSKNLPKHNAALIMAVCGSKGSNINLSQMIACVGQQTVNGKRVPNGFIDRSLPHFEPQSKYPAAKGFVQNSFYSGLTATEFFFHTIGGREGLIDTAVKTAETGYMQRRLMKSLEDLVVRYDRTVRSSEQTIIQFTYGDDGLDPMFMDDQKLPVSLQRLYIVVREATKKATKHEQLLTPGEIRQKTRKEIENCPLKNGISQNFEESLGKFMNELAVQSEQAILRLPSSFDETELVEDDNKERFLKNFASLTKTQFDEFIKLVWKTYERALIQPGEACGAVAAQSIGEPATQMTLKTFHFAGVASMNVTLGVPRIKEIINATEKISTPIINAHLENASSVVSARIVKGRIEKTELGDVAEYIKEVYTPEGCFLSIKLDLKAINALKLEVDICSIADSILKTPKLKVKKENLSIVGREKIKIAPYETGRDKMYFVMQQLKAKLPHVIIKGIPSIMRAVISKDQKEERYQLAIEGYGLREVMRISGIDFRKTVTNHILETASVLGIEAARQCIIGEIRYVMGEYGIQIDNRHIQLLADEMTFKGLVLGITRFGVQKMKNSVLMLASFEMTTDHLYNSAIQCKKDDLKGVTESIVMGTQVPIGTSLFKLEYDHTVQPDLKTQKDVVKGVKKDIEGVKGGKDKGKQCHHDASGNNRQRKELLFDGVN